MDAVISDSVAIATRVLFDSALLAFTIAATLTFASGAAGRLQLVEHCAAVRGRQGRGDDRAGSAVATPRPVTLSGESGSEVVAGRSGRAATH